ncbi:MAG: glycosyltransferase family 4 protein [Ignavibacteriae bacterium]|nr:glycosyltransferase WbuB [Ignavibacteriota bacterium]NOG98215.1 glycosyltransferase family 4 protein [Ignavibacteriota bacterium]
MKVLLYSHFYYPEVGAASTRMQYFVKSLKAAGHDVKVVTPLPNYPSNKTYAGFENINRPITKDEVTYLPIYSSENHSIYKRLYSYINYFFVSLKFVLFNNYKPDLIISSSPPLFTPFAAMIAAKVKGAKFILDVRDIWPDIGIELGLLNKKIYIWGLRLIEKMIMKGASFITVTAEADKENLVSKKVDEKKIFVLYNGADTKLFKASYNSTRDKIKNSFNLPDNKQIVLFVGSFNDGMNDIRNLGKALANFDTKSNNCHFVFAGDGSNRKEFFSELNGSTDYTYLGLLELDELSKLLSVADLNLVPRKMNKKNIGGNIPVKCFESWASEIPVLISAEKNSEIAKIFEQCNAGILIEPNDAESFRSSLEKILKENNLKEMGRRGRELVEKYYDRNKQSDKLTEIISKLNNHKSNS